MPVYKNKKTNKYYAKFNYRDYTGVIRQKKKEGFKTQKEAKNFERDFLNKNLMSSDILFSNLYEKYMEYQSLRLKPTTMSNKEVLYRLKILPYFKDIPINEIEPNHVMQWQNELMKKGYSETYLKTIHNQFSAILNFAMKYYRVEKNAARICGSMGKKHADIMQFYTIDEFKKFIIAFDNKISSKVIFTLMFYTGIRSGELLALRAMNFDFASKSMDIHENYARLDGEDLMMMTKTVNSKRVVVLPNFLNEMMKEYIARIPNLANKDRIFPFTKSHLNTQMKKGVEESGVKRIRVHDLRHSHASLLVELGFSPLLIAERLGHKDIKTTLQTYSHLYPNKQFEAALKLDELKI